MTTMNGVGKDLTKEPPRSPNQLVEGLAIIARTIDKCRAYLWGNVGEYHFDCPLDNTLFKFKGITGNDFKTFVETGASDEEIARWVKSHGLLKTDQEIQEWSEKVKHDNYSDKPTAQKEWLSNAAVSLGLDKDATLFDMLDADDKASFVRPAL